MHSLVEEQFTDVPAVFLNSSVVPLPSAKPLPLTVTDVPPASGPLAGLTLVTVGFSYLNTAFEFGALGPPLNVDTVTGTVLEVFGGARTVIEVGEFSFVVVAWTLPKVTVNGATKPVPVIVTEVPPEAGPFLAESFVTVGSDAGFRREQMVGAGGRARGVGRRDPEVDGLPGGQFRDARGDFNRRFAGPRRGAAGNAFFVGDREPVFELAFGHFLAVRVDRRFEDRRRRADRGGKARHHGGRVGTGLVHVGRARAGVREARTGQGRGAVGGDGDAVADFFFSAFAPEHLAGPPAPSFRRSARRPRWLRLRRDRRCRR